MKRSTTAIIAAIAIPATILVVVLSVFAISYAVDTYNFNKAHKVEAQAPASKAPTTDEILKLVNAERAKVGAQPLAANSVLNEAAQWKSDDMIARNYFAHDMPGTTDNYDESHQMTMKKVCTSQFIGENLAFNEGDSKAIVKSWMSSTSGHKEVLLRADRNLTGIGIAKGSYGAYYVTELFCSN